VDSPISIKGTREGLTITVNSDDVDQVIASLADTLSSQGAFFSGGQVALRAGDVALGPDALTRIRDLLTSSDLVLRTIVANDPVSRSSADALGLRLVPDQDAAGLSPRTRAATPHIPQDQVDSDKAILLRRMIRSGQVVRHTGDVVIVGDVNPGAEVAAGGDIYIWGRLHGIAHAGAMGDNTAVICALELSPMQLRIAQLVARAEESEHRESVCPEIAYVRNDGIVVEPWHKAPRRT